MANKGYKNVFPVQTSGGSSSSAAPSIIPPGTIYDEVITTSPDSLTDVYTFYSESVSVGTVTMIYNNSNHAKMVRSYWTSA